MLDNIMVTLQLKPGEAARITTVTVMLNRITERKRE